MAHRIFVFSARPARIIEEIDVTKFIPLEDRAKGASESEAFFALRNRILKILRDEYRRVADIERTSA
jgi:ABC-type nitrate/sulfonate/bicarbonate transport system ATPase subunit